jgi:hypothetical protein
MIPKEKETMKNCFAAATISTDLFCIRDRFPDHGKNISGSLSGDVIERGRRQARNLFHLPEAEDSVDNLAKKWLPQQ